MATGNHLIDALLRQARADAESGEERLFARLEDGRSYRYGDVENVSARFALALQSMGVRPGDRVAAQVEKSIEALMLYLATVRVGAVFLPLNIAYTASEVAYFLTDAEPALMVCDPERVFELMPHARAAGARIETMGVWCDPETPAGSFFDHVPDNVAGFADVPRGPEDLAAILYTSGTTGRSKGAMLSHGNLRSNAEVLVESWRFTAADRLIHALPIFHTHGLFVASNVTLLAGGALIWMARFDQDRVIAELANATVMMGVPTFYTRLLGDDRLDRDLTRHVRLFVSGSAPLLAETHCAWETRTGHAILERYGMTECSMITTNPYQGARRAGTVGHPLPGVELKVCDPETGTELARGEIGVIKTRGPNVFQGYWRMPEKTAEELSPDGWFLTGDLGMIDAEGYVNIVGRGKDLIISGGFNIYPKEVESHIDRIEGVLESAVIGVPHPDFGEGVVAVVVAQADAGLDAAAITGPLGDKLARFKQPKHVIFVEALPRNTMGKVQKNALRQDYADLFV